MRECGDWTREGMKDALMHEEKRGSTGDPPRNLADSPRPPGLRRAGAIVHSPLAEGPPRHQPLPTLQLLLYRAEQPPWGQRKPPPCPLQVGQMRHRCLRWDIFRELGSVPAAAGTVRWAKGIWAD